MKIKKIMIIAAVICLVSCDTPVVTFPQEDTRSLIKEAFADGSGNNLNVTSPTTKITFIFTQDMEDLHAADIYLEANFPFVKGNLKEIDKKTFELAVIPGKTGVIKAAVAPYTFGGWSVVSVKVFADYDFLILFDNIKQKNCIKIINYNNVSKVVNIPKEIINYPVTDILSGAFREKNLTSVVIPSGIEVIERAAFYANMLESIIIPDTVTNIGASAFNLNKLTDIKMSENVTVIGASAFANNLLEEPDIPQSVISLAGFENNMLTYVKIPESTEFIEDSAFMNNNISGIELNDIVKSIRNNAFAYNLLDELEIPDSVTEISGFNNNKFKEIELTPNILSIGYNAFANNQLEEITIPKKTRYIGSFAFANNQLEELIFEDGTELISIGEGAFQNNMLKKVKIPENVVVNQQAFTGNQLTEITISKGVTLIGTVFGNGFEVYCRYNENSYGTYKRDNPNTNIWEYLGILD